jgi:hypothetical protein
MIYVFIGPTIPVHEARAILQASYLAPAEAGDIAARVRDRPEAFALIDGYYEQRPAVRHKEILYALSEGIPVFGAASIGALRAAELDSFGMIGVGTIFEAFRVGTYTDDDEVAVNHAPASHEFKPLSDAMANIRAGLRDARRRELLTGDEHDRLVSLGKRRFYGDRTWKTLVRDGVSAGLDPSRMERLLSFVADTAPNAKRDDARALLKRLARREIGPPQVNFDFERTELFEHFLAAAHERLGGLGELE